jgi:hypothetical protein
MELWIWISALGLGLLVLLLAFIWLASRGLILAKKLKPFSDHLVKFHKDAKLYPEAVKFYSDLAKSEETPAKKPRGAKG